MPNRIHKDFRRMNDLLEFEELSYSVNEVMKQDKNSIKGKSPTHFKPTSPKLPHRAYMSPEYSLHIAQNLTNDKDFESTSIIDNDKDNTETTEGEHQDNDTLQMAVDSEEEPLAIPIID